MSKKIIKSDVAQEFVTKAAAVPYKLASEVEESDNKEFDNLFELPEKDFSAYMATNYASTYATMQEVPDSFYTADRWAKGTNYNSCFKGCAALTGIQWIFTHYATDLRYMFQGCAALPKQMPCPLDCYSITDSSMLTGMFDGSSVTVARFDNMQLSVALALLQHISILGSGIKAIVVNGFYVEVASA